MFLEISSVRAFIFICNLASRHLPDPVFSVSAFSFPHFLQSLVGTQAYARWLIQQIWVIQTYALNVHVHTVSIQSYP